MTGIIVPEHVYEAAAEADLRTIHAGTPTRYAVVTLAGDPTHRAAVDVAYRAGYQAGYDQHDFDLHHAAGEAMAAADPDPEF